MTRQRSRGSLRVLAHVFSAVLVISLILSACRTLDLNEPVALAPDSTLNNTEIEVLRQAADCWNRGFGVDFRVTVGDENISQVVEVFFDDLTCLTASAEYQITSPRAVSICRTAFGSTPFGSNVPLFDVLLHELGHVANIFGHSEGNGVLSRSGVRPAGSILFTSKDEERFAEANSNFQGTAECRLIRTESSGTNVREPGCECQ